MRVCGLAWNSGGAGIRSVAVGLHDVLGVGEFVELVDVGLGNHDVDGGEHSGLLVGSCIRVFLLGEVGDRPAGLARGACQRGCVGATLRVKQEKRRTSLAAVSGA